MANRAAICESTNADSRQQRLGDASPLVSDKGIAPSKAFLAHISFLCSVEDGDMIHSIRTSFKTSLSSMYPLMDHKF